jgi:hypothetical protein
VWKRKTKVGLVEKIEALAWEREERERGGGDLKKEKSEVLRRAEMIWADGDHRHAMSMFANAELNPEGPTSKQDWARLFLGGSCGASH